MTAEVFELKVPMLPGKSCDVPPLTANERLHWRRKSELVAMAVRAAGTGSVVA